VEDVCDHVGILGHGKVLLERSLAQLQDNMVKLQVVFKDGGGVPEDLKERMTRLYAEVYYDYCAGNGVEWGDVKNTSGYTLWQRVAPDNKYVGEMGEMVADVEKEQRQWEWKGAEGKPPEMPVRE